MPPCITHFLLPAIVLAMTARANGATPSEAPPPLPREFRAAWVATVHNLHWPSKAGLSTEKQQAEMIDLLDRAADLGLNAIILQVRPACDALYKSSLEPWSFYLTGESGRAPSPYYDPLEFAIEEAHRRGLELHAWFNPFRAEAYSGIKPSPDHVLRTNPKAIRKSGSMKWLDPGLEFSQRHSLAVVRDVVRRYDVDGVHIDDYFYPYPANNSQFTAYFNDRSTYAAYKSGGGSLPHSAWRRDNIDRFVKSLYAIVKEEKPWVKFGVSPCGIWRPDHPKNIKGIDAYEQIFADSRKWIREGWCDYFSPQLYWRIDDKLHSFPKLLEWWKGESHSGRHVWPGIASDRVASRADPGRGPGETIRQIEVANDYDQSCGHIHWSIAPLLENRRGLSDLLTDGPYRESALVPAFPWLSQNVPQPPAFEVRDEVPFDELTLVLSSPNDESLAWWAIQTRKEGLWQTAAILPASQADFRLEGGFEAVAATAIDRYGNASEAAVISVENFRFAWDWRSLMAGVTHTNNAIADEKVLSDWLESVPASGDLSGSSSIRLDPPFPSLFPELSSTRYALSRPSNTAIKPPLFLFLACLFSIPFLSPADTWPYLLVIHSA